MDKRKKPDELIIANKELAFQNEEKKKRAAELIIANKELAFQNEEKENRAAELVLANIELAFQNEEKENRAVELILANKELNQSAELLQKNLKEISDYKYALDESTIIAITDQKGIIKKVNSNFCKISKYSEEELIGQDHRIINSGYHTKEFIRDLWVTIANGKIWKGELKNKAKDGNFYWVDTTIVPFLNEEGKPYQYLAIRTDITDRKEAEENLIQRTAQLGTANKELAFQNKEKEKRAAELIIVNKELAFQNEESEEQFKAIFNDAPMGIAIIDSLTGNIFNVNPMFAKIAGRTIAEMANIDWMGITHPDDIQLDLNNMAQLLAGEINGFRMEKRYIHPDGSFVWINMTISKILYHNKSHPRHLCMIEDITERKRAEQGLIIANKELVFQNEEKEKRSAELIIANKELKKANERFELIGKATNDGLWDLNLETSLVWGNEVHQQMYGLSLADPVPNYEEWKHRIHPEDRERTVKVLEETMASEYNICITEYRFNTENIGWMNIYGRTLIERNKEGKPVRLIGSMMDITKRKKTEKEILRVIERYEMIAKATSDTIWDWDITNDKILYNEGITNIFGYEKTKIENIAGWWKNKIHPDDLQIVLEAVAAAFKRQSYNLQLEYRFRCADESFKYIYDRAFVIYDEYKKPCRMVGAMQDVSKLKENEISLNELNENLQKQAKELSISNEELEQFAYVASHDLQEPLRMVTSFLTQLEKKYGDVIDDKGKKYIFFAVDGAKRMRKIILDLLEFSRVGRTEDIQEELDLNELVNEIKILFRKKIEEKSAIIQVGQLPVINAHKAPILQVFQNLISNALKYTREDIPTQIHITAKELKNHWQFAVADNGIGISEEYFDKIFVIFQRLHNKDEYSGTGVGLAVTEKIIESQNGKIWVESEEGKGSIFYFTIKKNR